MKFARSYIALFFLWIMSAFFVSAREPEKFPGTVTVTPDSFLIKGSVFYLYLNIQLSKLEIGRYETMSFLPVLRTDKKEFLFQPVVVNGNNKQKMYRRAVVFNGEIYAKKNAYEVLQNNPEEEEEIVYTQSVEFKEWMKNATFVLKCELRNYAGKPKVTYIRAICDTIEIRKE